LESAGYAVLTAKDGTEALAIAEQSDEPIHLLLTDVVMPKMRGPELAKRLKGLRTRLRIVYMSGYLEYNRATMTSWRRVSSFKSHSRAIPWYLR